MCEDPEWQEIVAVCCLGQPFSEALAMSVLHRKAFLYTHKLQNGWSINWSTGDSTPPKTE